jgi:hypothetical protein
MMPASYSPKHQTVDYFDPAAGCRVQKDVAIRMPSGLTVQEIPSVADLKSKWHNDIVKDLEVPLVHHARGVLREELLKAFTNQADRDAVTRLCETWQPNDDRAVKLLGRLLMDSLNNNEAKMHANAMVDRLAHEKALLEQERGRLIDERNALTADVGKLMSENAKLLRGQQPAASTLAAERAGAASRILELDQKLNQTTRQGIEDRTALNRKIDVLENTLTQTIRQKADVERERDILRREAQRNVEIALSEYETGVMTKLAKVGEEHKAVVAENNSLKSEVQYFKRKNIEAVGEIHSLKSETNKARAEEAQEKEKKNSMNEVNTAAVTPVEGLSSGDEVYCKVSGEGPFVLVTQIEESTVEYSNPVAGRKNAFNVGKLPLYNAWLVRCKDTTFRTLPAATLTKATRKSSFSLAGVRGFITSDVTAKVAQAAIWATMLTMLYMQRG